MDKNPYIKVRAAGATKFSFAHDTTEMVRAIARMMISYKPQNQSFASVLMF